MKPPEVAPSRLHQVEGFTEFGVVRPILAIEWVRSALVLLAIWAGIFLPTLGTLELKGEEGRRMMPGQTMLRNGDWIVPQVGGEAYLRKPPMINWLAAASFKTFGVENEWTGRLPSVLGILLLVLMILFMGAAWLGIPSAVAAAVFTMTNFAMIDKGRSLEIDALYSAATGIAIVAWLRGWMLERPRLTWLMGGVAGVALGISFLLKGPVNLLFFYAVLVAVLWKARDLQKIFHPAHLLAACIAVGLFALWWVPFHERAASPGGALLHQLTDRLDGSDFELGGWLLNIPRGLANLLPWSIFFCFAWVPLRHSTPEKIRSLYYGLRWAVIVGFLLISLAPGALPRYTMPVTVPFALLISLLFTWGLLPERLWKIWRTVTGGGVGNLKILAQRSGLLFVILIGIYSLTVVPQLKEKSLWRTAAGQINALIPEGETLYAVDPGSQPIFFYLKARYEFVDQAAELPQNARYVLALGKSLAEVRKRHPAARTLFRYQDRGEKTSFLLAL